VKGYTVASYSKVYSSNVLPQPDRKGCCRTFLKDLGIIQERERKIEVIGNLKMLWERESDDRENDAVVIDAEANRVD
jgi:hypothetical protein